MSGLRLIGCLVMVCASACWGEPPTPTTEKSVSPTVAAVISGNNAFALDLYNQLSVDPASTADGNLFFSPYSVDAALMMVRAGAAGTTAKEMGQVLKLPDLDAMQIDGAMGDLSRRFNGDAAHQGYQLQVANAMWGQVGEPFLPQYVNRLKTDFASEANWVDFRMAREAAQTINDWVGAQTHDRITHLIDSAAINDRTKLILTNAIYFKGTWSKPFKTRATREMPWNDGTAPPANVPSTPMKTVPMMSQRGAFDYVKETGLSALQMPYAGNEMAMLVLLPDSPSGLPDLEKSLDATRLKEIVGELRPGQEVEVTFPKFKMETSYDLSRTLAKMGMATAFSDEADLSGIDGKRDLSITGVIHKAFVQVDESGTEASAATGVMVGAMAMRRREVFLADHPFLFLIRDLKTGTILFLGRVVNPEQ